MITNIIFILLAFLVSAFVVMPLLSGRLRSGSTDNLVNHRANDLEDRKQTLYAAIKDIEFDFQMGKLSEDDFQTLRQQYKDEAVQVLREMDNVQTVGATKARRAVAADKNKNGKADIKFCWACGTGLDSAEKFCPGCGQLIREA